MLDALLGAGVDVCRVNLSHGPIESSLARVAQVREAAARAKRYVAVLCDLPGPKIRTALFAGGGVEVAPGHRLQLVEAGPRVAMIFVRRPRVTAPSVSRRAAAQPDGYPPGRTGVWLSW